ncbi:MAG: hypothetical protein HC933_18425 [Pleurocapsa sp. SU_196_0]|nr:hypothetical protein [Pleurocapsa sp. SU_196_0]
MDWQSLAQALLTNLWGQGVTCTVKDALRDEGRNRVYRLELRGAPVATVILKASLGDEEQPYIVGDDAPWRPFSRFCNEWAGCDMLAPLGLGPKVYAGSLEHGFYLMEDLEGGESLADRLTGNDPVATTAALLAYARSLGALHAATRQQAARWLEVRGKLSPHTTLQPDTGFQGDASAFKSMCERYGIIPSNGFDVEIRRIEAVLLEPGAYLAFSPTDCCPDNHFLRGDRVVFFDCEGATMRHALLDVTYLLAPFPTCWCTSRLPRDLTPRLLEAYREQFVGESDFETQLTLVLATWIVRTLTWKWAGDWEVQDHQWGLVSLRQRHLHRLENLLARDNLETLLPEFARVVSELRQTLRSSWTDVQEMPLYPAYASNLESHR